MRVREPEEKGSQVEGNQNRDDTDRRESAWLEAIALFQEVRDGNHLAATALVNTCKDHDLVVSNLLRMMSVFLRGEETDKLDRFVESSHRAGPPPVRRPII